MSAHTEQLLTEIKDAEDAFQEAKATNQNPAAITTIAANLAKLRARLAQANEALTESRQVLKG